MDSMFVPPTPPAPAAHASLQPARVTVQHHHDRSAHGRCGFAWAGAPLTIAALSACLGTSPQPATKPAELPAPNKAPGAPADFKPFTQTLPGTTITFDMVPIPAGTLRVPDPADPNATKELDIPALYFARTETTWDLYDIFVYRLDEPGGESAPGADATTRPSKPYLPPDLGMGHSGYPVISVAFQGADAFCKWLSEKTGRTYRLPTEAEWEHAARSGLTGDYGFQPGGGGLDDYAWFSSNSKETTHPVAQKKPSRFGLYDMHGNVAEWTTGLDGKPVARGGSYQQDASDVKVTSRMPYSRSWQVRDPQIPKSKWWLSDCSFVGFRIVCEPGPTKPAPAPQPPPDKQPAPPPGDKK